jgi:hypothetical protein
MKKSKFRFLILSLPLGLFLLFKSYTTPKVVANDFQTVSGKVSSFAFSESKYRGDKFTIKITEAKKDFVIEEELLFIFNKASFEKTIKKGIEIEMKVPKAISNGEGPVNVYEVKSNQKIYLSLEEALARSKVAGKNFFWGGMIFLIVGVLRLISYLMRMSKQTDL